MEDYKKKYEDALNAARKFKNDCPSLWDTESNPFRNVFEELKESEDERISKALIHLINEQDDFLIAINGISVKDVIAWLEKQGKVVEEYEDKLDRCACESFDKGYKAALEKQGEHKPTWSEEDEKYYDSALWHIKNSCGIEGNIYNWLKSLKERIKGE